MGKISSYGTASAPSLGDKLIGTSVGGNPVNGTYNFTIQQLADLISGQVNLQEVLNTGNTATQTINLTGTINATSLFTTNSVGVGTATVASKLHVAGTFRNVLTPGVGGQTILSAIDGISNGYLIAVDTSNNITHKWHTGANQIALQVTANGSLLINKATAFGGYKLEVDGQSYLNGYVQISGNLNVGELTIGGAQGFGDGIIHGQGDEVIATWDLGNTGNYLYGNQQLVVRNGNTLLGYGNSSITSSDRLQVNGNGYFTNLGGANITIAAASAGSASLILSSNITGGGKSIINAPLATGSLALQINTVDRVIINDTGIEVRGNGYFTNPSGACNITIASQYGGSATLTLASQFTGSNRAVINSSLSTASLVFQTNTTDRMLIDANGSLLINKSTSISSEYKLQVQGNVSILGYLQTNSIGTSEVFMSDLYISGDYGIGLGMGIFSSIGDQIIASWDYQDSNDYIYGNGILRINGNSNIVNINGLPTSSAGLLSGDLWRNGTVVNIVP